MLLSTGDMIIPAGLNYQPWRSDHSSGAVQSTGDLIIPAVLYYQLEITHDNRRIKNAYSADQ